MRPPVFLLLIPLLLVSAKSFGQQAQSAISLSDVNEKYLEHLIKEKIDEVRVQHNLKLLYNDSILYVAAKFHSKYLFNKGALSHTEPENKEMETPQKRAEHFGTVNYLVGENVAYTVSGVPAKDKKGKVFTNVSYDDVATDLVTMWVHSPGHYRNIITPDYNATGLAVWIDPKTNRIYAVQKFAEILYKYEFTENRAFFPYSNYVGPSVAKNFDTIPRHLHKGLHIHRIKALKDSSLYWNCVKNQEYLHFCQTKIEVKNGNIFLTSRDPVAFFNLLKKRRDGLAAEIVPYGPFDCGNPQYYTLASRRNGQCIFSGKVLKPLYRKKALRGFKPGGKKRKHIQKKIDQNKVKSYSIKLGKVPKKLSSYSEINLVILQKKQVAYVMHFSSVCGDTLEYFYDLPFIHDSLTNNTVLESEHKKVRFAIPFEKKKTDYKLSDIKPITDSLLSDNFIADTIEIHTFSSVEGKENVNKQLQELRARNIAHAISTNQKEKLVSVITAQENWTLFEEQIEKNKDLKDFKGLTHEQVKERLNDTLQQKKIENFLNKQRVAEVKLGAHIIVSPKDLENYLLKKVTVLKKKILTGMGDEKSQDSVLFWMSDLSKYMDIAYNNTQSGVIQPGFFSNFEISNDKQFKFFNFDKLRYKIQIKGIHDSDITWVREIYGDIVNLYNQHLRSFFVNYNMLNLIQRHETALGVTVEENQHDAYIAELYTYAKTEEEKKLVEKLDLNFRFQVCRLPRMEQSSGRRPLVDKSLGFLHDYYQNKTLSTEELNKLGAFYLYHSEAIWVKELMWPEFEKKHNNPEGLSMLAKAMYHHYEETRNSEYYEFLKQVHAIVGSKAWCPMFVGPCNISFQSLDYELFRDFYCEQCHDYLNYAKDLKQSAKK